MNADRTLLNVAELSLLLPGQAGKRGVTVADVGDVLWLGHIGVA